MAFFGVLIINIVGFILILIFFLSIILLAVSIILKLLYKKRKNNESINNKTIWLKRASVICFVLSLFILSLFGGAFLLLSRPQSVLIETEEGSKKISKSVTKEFVNAIAEDNESKVSLMLSKKPELMDFITAEGYNPLGAAIRFDSLSVADYLLKSGVDPNKAGGRGSDTSVALVCRMSFVSELNIDMLELLLNYNVDVNSSSNVMPPVQFFIEYMCEDENINERELLLLDKFLQRGADLTAVNGTGKDALAYFESLIDKKNIDQAQASEVIELLDRYSD